jgi:large subunit ribosomal protein L30e
MSIDLARALRLATDTGDVRFGIRQVRKAVKSRQAKLVIVSSNCPPAAVEGLTDVRLFRFPGTNADLGASCGVPFSVAALAVLSPGNSNILSA